MTPDSQESGGLLVSGKPESDIEYQYCAGESRNPVHGEQRPSNAEAKVRTGNPDQQRLKGNSQQPACGAPQYMPKIPERH